MRPEVTLRDFDSFLKERGLSFQGVVIGASALALLGVISRETRDCDVLDPEIPDAVKQASREFAAARAKSGALLKGDWLNNGPERLRKDLPAGWLKRCVPLFSGKALTLLTLDRADLLRTKLFAFCDRQQDLEDCVSLAPTKAELFECLPWVKQQDANVDWPAHVDRSFSQLGKRLGYEF
jgi:hypothetical protein